MMILAEWNGLEGKAMSSVIDLLGLQCLAYIRVEPPSSRDNNK